MRLHVPLASMTPIWCACQSPFGMMGKIYIWNTGGGGGPHSGQASGAAVRTLLMTVTAKYLATTAFGK
ncbi:Nitrogen assimilation transcription factor nirA [Fusarium oxysporum f. sp. albedinis]|nr:Nitrogen assimilation transcription factor nirA [Fusarium oxysporum f. sp. albedinis]